MMAPLSARAVTSLQTGSNQVSAAQSQAGTSVNIFTSAVSTCTQQNTDETKIISQLGDADVMDASTRLSLAQYAPLPAARLIITQKARWVTYIRSYGRIEKLLWDR
jgi:hypothetical protein